MAKHDSFFEKLGRSLKIDDTKYEANLAYDGDEDDFDSSDLSDEEAEALDGFSVEELEKKPKDEPADELEEGELEEDEEMLKELGEDEPEDEDLETPIATLAASSKKSKRMPRKPKTSITKTNIKTRDAFDEYLEEGRLNIDVYELDDEVVIKSAIAGVNEDDLDIDISPDSVTIRGKRTHGEQISDENYFYKECYWGAFSRSVRLHTEIDPDKSDAILENGILSIRLPKLSKSNQKKLKVKKI